MDDEALGLAITRAERAARHVTDSGLREKAFEVVLARLLVSGLGGDSHSALNLTASQEGGVVRRESALASREPKTLTQRVLALHNEGFFEEPKGIGKVRQGLGVRGWHYPVTTLSGVLQVLSQKRRLRRERVREGRKTVWMYSNP